MEQVETLWPEISMTINGHVTCSLLDLGSEVTLVNESYCKESIKILILPPECDIIKVQNLFSLKGGKDGCVPLPKYFTVDIQVGGRVVYSVYRVGFLVKKMGKNN